MRKIVVNLFPPILLLLLKIIILWINFLKYKSILSRNTLIKDIHKGKRCFLLGSAPSIMKENLKPLKDEIVFALNNFFVHEDFLEIMDSEVSKYYITPPIHPPQTEDEWKQWFSQMQLKMPKNTTLLFGLNLNRVNIRYLFKKYRLFRYYDIFWLLGCITLDKDYSFNFNHLDIRKPIWSANTVSTYALIVAIYMGFEEIYLVGIDHNYILLDKDSNFRFYGEANHQKNEQLRMNVQKSDEFFSTAMVLKECEWINMNIKNTKIFNCSNESILNMFPRVSLKKILETDLN